MGKRCQLLSEEEKSVLKTSLGKGLIVTAIVVVCYAVGALLISTESFDPIQNIINNYNLSDFYFRFHTASDRNDGEVIIVDISDMDTEEDNTRSQIAALIEIIDQARPSVIGLDVFFSAAAMTSKEDNDSLIHVLQRIQTPLVAASKLKAVDEQHNRLISSFFMPLMTENSLIREGIVDFPRESKTIRTYRPVWYNEGDTLPSFAKQIADLAGIPMADNDEQELIDFADMDQHKYRSDSAKYLLDLFSDRIVLIGAINDERDLFPIPVTLNTSRKCPGVEIHKQILLTAQSGWKPKKVAQWLDILISILVVWIISVLFLFWNNFNKGKYKIRIFWFSPVVIILIFIIGHYLFWNGTYFSMIYILTGLVLVPTSIDLMDALIKRFTSDEQQKKDSTAR